MISNVAVQNRAMASPQLQLSGRLGFSITTVGFSLRIAFYQLNHSQIPIDFDSGRPVRDAVRLLYEQYGLAHGPNAMKLVFGEFILDFQARQLWRGGAVVPLEPKMYQLLDILIKRRPAVIANEELDTLLWPHVFVARTSLTRLVSALRSVLGDEARDSRIIRTAYKTGYAFCGKVTSADMTPTPAAPTQRQSASVIHLVWNDRVIALVEGEHIAGRGDECSLVIDATTVSRRHAKVVVRGGSITIEDLASTNGTQVNGVPITAPTAIASGNKIELGSEVLVVRKRSGSDLTVRMDPRMAPTRASL